MPVEPILVDREKLYDQVWAEPMVRVAKQYGISDVALAKVCKKLQVPVPGRGYWQRKVTGKPVRKPSLPKLAECAMSTATIGPGFQRKPEKPEPESVQRQIEFESRPENRIGVAERLSKVHPILARMKPALGGAEVDDYGAIGSRESCVLNLRASRKSLNRAVRILNAVYWALDTRGYKVSVSTGDDPTVRTTIFGEPIRFGIQERFHRTERL